MAGQNLSRPNFFNIIQYEISSLQPDPVIERILNFLFEKRKPLFENRKPFLLKKSSTEGSHPNAPGIVGPNNTCFIIIVTPLRACKLSKIAFNIQTSKAAKQHVFEFEKCI